MDNATTIENLNILSLQTLNLQASALACWSLIGTVAIISNICVVITIVKSKSLHSKFFCSLASLAVADLCSGSFFMIQGLKKLIYVILNKPETSSQLSCLLQMVPGIWGLTVSDSLTLGLSLDRLLAMALPIVYRMRLGNNYVLILNLSCWTFSTIFSATAFYVNDLRKLFHVCYAVVTPDLWFQNLMSEIRMCQALANLLLFTTTLIILKIRLRKSRSMSSEERRRQKESMEINMIKTLGVILIVYALLKWGSSILLTSLLNYMPPNTRVTVTPFNALLPCLYSASHFFVYLGMSITFRKAFCKVILKRKTEPVLSNSNRVVPSGVRGSGQ